MSVLLMLAWLNISLLPLLARLCLAGMFPFSGLDKILHWQEALKQANSSFLPCGRELLLIGIAIEFLTPFGIVAGWHDHLSAFILAGFCVVTAILYHQFWRYSDFWAPANSAGRAHFWDFLKNFGLAGGLLLLILAARFLPLSVILAHPLASAPVSAVSSP